MMMVIVMITNEDDEYTDTTSDAIIIKIINYKGITGNKQSLNNKNLYSFHPM